MCVHYPFSSPRGADIMEELWKEYVEGRKVGAIWITEDYGNGADGPADLVDRAARFIDWVASQRLDHHQTRIVWWGTGHEHDPGGAILPTIEYLGTLLGGTPVRHRRVDANGCRVHQMLNPLPGGKSRITILVAPQTPFFRTNGGPRKPVNEKGIPWLDHLVVKLPASISTAGWSGQLYLTFPDAKPVVKPVDIQADASQLKVTIQRTPEAPLILSLSRE